MPVESAAPSEAATEPYSGPPPVRGQAPAQVDLDAQTLASRTTHADTANVRVIPALREGLSAGFIEAQETQMLPADKYERSAMLGWMVTGGTLIACGAARMSRALARSPTLGGCRSPWRIGEITPAQ